MLERLKRSLRPIRPVLLPVWHRVAPLVEPSTAWQPFAGPAAPPSGPIRALTQPEFEATARRHTYYGARGRYLSVAARVAGELIAAHDLQTALELGPYLRPVVVGADVIDIRDDPDLEIAASGRRIIHDATSAPWPFADGQYDLFVALQVFEHLRGAQGVAFREACRVARHVVISAPIDWQMDDPRNCHHAISNEHALSWFLPSRPTRIEVGNPGPRKRLIYVFEDVHGTVPDRADSVPAEAEGDRALA